MADLSLPSTMGCIVRTAGLSRTKVEIKRDFDYLARLWDEIRENTLKSEAPALIYQDSDLIKRAIRDIYNKDIDEVIVEGANGYRDARQFMKLLMPSHVKRVKDYADPVPLFQRYGAEDQLSAMYQPLVQLKSGGYVVINPTEALVSIDINSGRSTREHNIEQTAFSTNIEAAHEIARQLRLRDMAGLVVIDFIDMESNGHIRKVEKAMKDALKNDRARIQVGRISSLRADGDEPPAPAHRRARGLDPALPALRGHRADAHRLVGGPVGAAHARGRGRPRPRLPDRASRRTRGGGLSAQQEARRDRRGRGALRRPHRGADRREPRRRADERRIARAAAGRAPAPRPACSDRGGRRTIFVEDEIDEEEDEAEDEAEEEPREARAAAPARRDAPSADARRDGDGRKRRRRRGRRGGRRREPGEGGEGAEGVEDDEAPAEAVTDRRGRRAPRRRRQPTRTAPSPPARPAAAPAPASATRRRSRGRARRDAGRARARARAGRRTRKRPSPSRPAAAARRPKRPSKPPVDAGAEAEPVAESAAPEAANDAAPPKRRRKAAPKAAAAEPEAAPEAGGTTAGRAERGRHAAPGLVAADLWRLEGRRRLSSGVQALSGDQSAMADAP